MLMQTCFLSKLWWSGPPPDRAWDSNPLNTYMRSKAPPYSSNSRKGHAPRLRLTLHRDPASHICTYDFL